MATATTTLINYGGRLDYAKCTNVDEFSDYNDKVVCKVPMVPLNPAAWEEWQKMRMVAKTKLMIGIRDDLRHRGVIGPDQNIIFCSPAGYLEH